ncbi:MAG: phosphotransferase [Phycisphaerales bacterium]
MLRDMCGGRLGEISWFRATWQHGGAATGYSTWTTNEGRSIDCVVKLPVGYTEYFWTKRLGLVSEADWDSDDAMTLPTPRVLAAGFELGGYDFAWIVMERLAGPPMASNPTSQGMWEIFETAAEFHAAAITEQSIAPERAPEPPDWASLIAKARKAVAENDLDDTARWVSALERAAAIEPDLRAQWASRDIDTWCHLDLHGRNAMRRQSPDPEHPGHCVLIDLAMVRPGSWVEDALYLERLYWGHEEMLCGVDPVSSLARAREFNGLPVGEGYDRLADLRRVLMAASVPAFLGREGDRKYLAHAVELLERLLPAFERGSSQPSVA